MSCRSTACGSAASTHARITVARDLPDAVVVSTFHELRRQYNPADQHYTEQDYHRLLDDLEHSATTSETFTPARQRSLLQRIAAARNEMPSPDIVHAAAHIAPTLRRRYEAMRGFTRALAHRTGEDPDTVHQRFLDLVKNAPRQRTHRNHTAVQERHLPLLSYGLGRDQGVLHAAETLQREAETIEITRANRLPRRITDHHTCNHPTPLPGYTITSVGVDPRNGRVEIVLTHHGHSRIHAYTNTTPELRDDLLNGDTAETWYTVLRGNPEHQYPSEHAATLDAAAPRCSTCGQYAATTHECPVPAPTNVLTRWGSQSRWSQHTLPASNSDHTISVTLPAIREIRETVNRGPTRVQGLYQPLPTDLTNPTDTDLCYLNGDAYAWRSPDGTVHTTAGGLHCTCPRYLSQGRCDHQDLITTALHQRLTPTTRPRRTAQQREHDLQSAQQRAAAAAASDWTRSALTRAEAARTWISNPDVCYSTNPEAFRDAVAQAAAAGPSRIPYLTTGAFDGLATRDHGQGFGLEIEFDLPKDLTDTQRRTQRLAIAQTLHREGLTTDPTQQPYGTSRLRGPRRSHTLDDGTGAWVFEHDGTVNGGELVTSIMFDEEETWQRLERAITIIRDNGGVTSRRTGLHVHVGVPTQTPAGVYEELGRLAYQHEDVLYRLASDPHRGIHRRTKYSRPLPDLPPQGFTEVGSVHQWAPRLSAVNFASVTGRDGGHLEFRLFDGTLNPGAIQAHTNLAVSITAAAERIHHSGEPTQRGREEWGAHAARRKARGSRRALTVEEHDLDSATTRSFLDTVYRRSHDKEQAAALYAHTRWTFPPSRRAL